MEVPDKYWTWPVGDSAPARQSRDTIQGNPQVAEKDTFVLRRKDSVQWPSPEEIRNWKWQRDKKMFITDSRYLPYIDDLQVATTNELLQHELKLPYREINRVNNDWVTVVLMVSLVILASVRAGFAKYIGSLFQSVFNYSTSLRMFGEKNFSFLGAAARLEAMFYLLIALFVYLLMQYFSFNGEKEGWLLYLRTLGWILAFFMAKKLIYHFLGFLFGGLKETSEFLYNMNNFNRVTGIVLLPVVGLFAFNPFEDPGFIIVLGILAILVPYLFLLQRGVSILLKKQFSIFYLFLYLCTLEFLPLLLIFKIVVE